jgi:Arc/MetJ-type ribon-helix-helix transcriptional regulator
MNILSIPVIVDRSAFFRALDRRAEAREIVAMKNRTKVVNCSGQQHDEKSHRTQPWAPGSQSGEMLWLTSGNFAAKKKKAAITTSAWAVPEGPRRQIQRKHNAVNGQKTLTRCKNQPITIPLDGKGMVWMIQKIEVLRPKGGETEKITINLGPVDLGQIDLLVEEGFYSNRTDLIRTAIRNQLATHSQVVNETVTRRALVLGMQHFSKHDLEAARAAGERFDIQVLGLASIAADVSAELALDTIASIVVLGAFHASPAVKAALAGRIG